MVPWGRGVGGACRSPDMLTLGVGMCAGSGYHLGDWKGWVYAAWTQDKEATVWSRVGSLQSWTRRTTSRLSTTAAHGSPRRRGGSSGLWVRRQLILYTRFFTSQAINSQTLFSVKSPESE